MLKRIIIVVILFNSIVSFAQEGTSSPYSFFGIGELKFKGSVENRAMGGISVYMDSIHLSLQNPAGIAGLKLVNFSVAASYKYVSQKTKDELQNTTSTSIEYIAIGIPMGKFGASFGLIPFSSVGYKLISELEEETTDYTGTGGLNKAFLTLAYSISPKLSVGIETNYNFGNIENTAFNQITDLQFATLEINKSDLIGLNFNFGAAYKTMVSESLEFSASITYTPENDFTSENFRELTTILVGPTGGQIIIDSREIPVEDTDFTFPSQISFGAGIGKPKNWFIGAEYISQKTSNFVNRTFSIDDVEFKDASKFKMGGFFIPNYNSFGNYWKRVVYRAGIRFEETGISVRGENIDEFNISFGVGLPVGRLFSNFNIGFEIGIRGTKNQGLVQENFFNTFLSLSLNDKWFDKRYYD